MTGAAPRLLLLDFSGVLFADAMGVVQTAIARAGGLDRAALGDFYAGELRDGLWRGTLGEPEFWRRLLRHAGLPDEPAPWRTMLLDRTTPLPACDRLRDWRWRAGLRLLSNQRTEWVEAAMRRAGVLDAFERLHVSDRLGHLKPEPEAYAAVAATWDGSPGAILFVDDQRDYLEAAARHGFATLAADPGGDWRAEVDAWLAT